MEKNEASGNVNPNAGNDPRINELVSPIHDTFCVLVGDDASLDIKTFNTASDTSRPLLS
jgi:hypothetical protein